MRRRELYPNRQDPTKINIEEIVHRPKNFIMVKKILEHDRKKKHFFVPLKEIKSNNYDPSISKYKELEYEEKTFEKPAILKKKILGLEKSIIDILKELPKI